MLKFNDIAEQAKAKKFTKSYGQLKQMGQFFHLIEASIKNTPLDVYIDGMLNELSYQMKNPGVTDEAISKHLTEMSKALQITLELFNRMNVHRNETVNDVNKRKIQAEFIEAHEKLCRQERITLNEILKLNQILARTLKEVHGENLAPATSPTPVAPQAESNSSNKLGFKFLDALSNLFKGFSGKGNVQSALQSFAGTIVEFVVSAIGDFFKAFLGKEAAPKVDKLVKHAGKALQKMFVTPEAETPEDAVETKEASLAESINSSCPSNPPIIPRFIAVSEKEKEKEQAIDDRDAKTYHQRAVYK